MKVKEKNNGENQLILSIIFYASTSGALSL